MHSFQLYPVTSLILSILFILSKNQVSIQIDTSIRMMITKRLFPRLQIP